MDDANMINHQMSYMMASNTRHFVNTTDSGNSFSNFLYLTFTMLFSSLFAGFIGRLVPKFGIYTWKIYDKINIILSSLGILNRKFSIELESNWTQTQFGRRHCEISEEKKAVLKYIQKNLKSYKDLYCLLLQYQSDYVYNEITGEDYRKDHAYYEINQSKSIIVKGDKKRYIKIQCWCDRKDSEQDGKNNNGLNRVTIKQTNTMSIICNYGMKPIYDFINDCVEEYKEDLKKDKTRNLYTYIGCETTGNKKPQYECDEFIPYASFRGLVGKVPKDIEKDFDFFQSKEGEKYHKDRNLPYHITHCYHGIPGTGKSIIACAIAEKYNLHIVRLRLSDIKTSGEFLKVLRNNDFNGRNIEYKDILYLFDEFDTELTKLNEKNKNDHISLKEIKDSDEESFDTENDIKNNTYKMKKKLKGMNVVINSHSSELTFGVILEEMNGINQMYGRKMIIITNNIDKLRSIHHGAFLRPGRIDRLEKLEECTTEEIVELLNIHYPGKRISRADMKKLINKKYTPAFLTNICKISKNINIFFKNLEYYTNK